MERDNTGVKRGRDDESEDENVNKSERLMSPTGTSTSEQLQSKDRDQQSPTSIAQLTSQTNQNPKPNSMVFSLPSPGAGGGNNNNNNNNGGGGNTSPQAVNILQSERDRDRERDKERERERERERDMVRERLPSPFEPRGDPGSDPAAGKFKPRVVSPKMILDDGEPRESLPSMSVHHPGFGNLNSPHHHFGSPTGTSSPPHPTLPSIHADLSKPPPHEFNISRQAQQIHHQMIGPSSIYGGERGSGGGGGGREQYPPAHQMMGIGSLTNQQQQQGGGGRESQSRSGSTSSYGMGGGRESISPAPPSQSPPPPQQAAQQSPGSTPQRQAQFDNAFNFLEQVKLQFAKEPQIYNQFLDIMKDLKAHNIDTPGVIARVTDLFKGHKHLILGFNTFLPAEYRIEMPDPQEGRQFVSSPTPIQQHPQQSNQQMTLQQQHQQILQQQQQQALIQQQHQQQLLQQREHQQKLLQQQQQQQKMSQQALLQQQQQQQQQREHQIMLQQQREQQALLHQQQQQQQMMQQQQQNPAAQKKQVELDHARNYVKKIKDRFLDEPDIYKKFLKVLNDYQQQQQPINEVYDQVAELFRSHTDLLHEFTQFLPDQSAGAGQPVQQHPQQMGGHMSTTQPVLMTPKQQKQRRNNNPYTPGKMQQGMDPNVDARMMGGHMGLSIQQQQMQQQLQQQHQMHQMSQQQQLHHHQQQQQQHQQQHQQQQQYMMGGDKRKRNRRPGEADMMMGQYDQPMMNSFEESEFFLKVRHGVASAKLYNEFLKCLNLFSQDIISRTELVLLVKDILLPRQPLLYDWFKQFIGVDEQSLEILERQEQALSPSKQTAYSEVDFTTCKRLGPSYRALPKNYPQPKCTGRTELSAEVLNDVWVSFPTGSEDFGFKSQRKNQFEEILFKCEDERFELDLVIELNASTIKVLDPLYRSILEIPEPDRIHFRMPTLDVLHHRSIERIYGNRGVEMVSLMYQNPLSAIPVIVKRLKQKDQEWTKAKREWNKVWKETTEKNYYRSLDYQSTFFKQSEKKTLTPKMLLAEIRQKFTEKIKEKEEIMLSSKSRRSKQPPIAKSPPYHLLYSMLNYKVCSDISNLIIFAADKIVQNKQDIEKIENFLNFFLLSFFFLKDEKYQQQKSAAAFSQDEKDQPKSSSSNDKEKDEKKDKDDKKDKDKENNNNNNGKEEKENNNQNNNGEDIEMKDQTNNSTNDQIFNLILPKLVSDKDKRVFFGNNTFYIFLRLYQILYERLFKVFDLAEAAKQAHWTSKPNVTRFFRNMQQNPTDANNESMDGVDSETNTSESELSEVERYDRFIKCLMELIANNIDQSHYEDSCRSYLGISSYIVFTLDKLINQLTRQLQSLLSSENCLKLLYLFTLEVKQPNGWSDTLYHSKVIEVLKDDRVFLFEFEAKGDSIGAFTIELLDPTSPQMMKNAEAAITENEKLMHQADSFMDRSKQYINNFKQLDSTIDPRQYKVFLLRNIPKNVTVEQAMTNTISETGLECRICTQTFRLFYVEDTEDFFYRNGRNPKPNTKKLDFEKIKANCNNPPQTTSPNQSNQSNNNNTTESSP